MEVEGWKRVLVERELRGGGEQKEAAGSYISRGPEGCPSRKGAAGRGGKQKEAEGSSGEIGGFPTRG